MNRPAKAVAALLLLACGAASARHPETTAGTAARPGPASETPAAALASAAAAYKTRDWDSAAKLVEPLLKPTPQLGSDDEVAARKILAVARFYQHRVLDAESEFKTLLQLDDGFRLDHVLDPPEAVAYLEDLRRRVRERTDQLVELQRLERERDAERNLRREAEQKVKIKPVVVERPVEKRWLALAFVPFGVGQFQNGDRKKGFLFLGSQLAFGLTSLAIWSYLEINYQNGSVKVPLSEIETARNLDYSAIAFGALFWADVGVGIVDALIHYRGKVTITPAPLPGGGGLSLQGVF